MLHQKQLNLLTHKWVKAKVASQPAGNTPQQQQHGSAHCYHGLQLLQHCS
jgi:hypothetical protein